MPNSIQSISHKISNSDIFEWTLPTSINQISIHFGHLTISLNSNNSTLTISANHASRNADGDIAIQANNIHIHATKNMHLSAGQTMMSEAHSHQIQANHGNIEIQANRTIQIDGEHIGLNDKPTICPFDWSAIYQPFG